jgi:hypothetical protein
MDYEGFWRVDGSRVEKLMEDGGEGCGEESCKVTLVFGGEHRGHNDER